MYYLLVIILIFILLIIYVIYQYSFYKKKINNTQLLWDKIYLLNLKRRKDKLNKVLNELENNNIQNIHIIYGIDGVKLPEQKILVKNKILHPNFLKYKWVAQNRGAIGNYLSMSKIYQNIINNNSQISLIFEDDIIINKDFWKVINDFKNLNFNDWDLIYLGISNLTRFNTEKNWKKFLKINDKYSLYIPDSSTGDLYGNFGLMVKKKVAEVWLNNHLPIVQASDSRLGSLVLGKKITVENPEKMKIFEQKLKGYIIVPPIITYTFEISDTNNIL
jgi:GR25 family glycosyltransferase involved in LPS biosynthesis